MKTTLFLLLSLLALPVLAQPTETQPAGTQPAGTLPPREQPLAVLSLEAKISAEELTALKSSFSMASLKVLAVVPVSGDSIENLMAFYACSSIEASCLGKITKALKVRYLLFATLPAGASASAPASSPSLRLTVTLFDSSTQAITATEIPLSSMQDEEAIRASLKKFLSPPETSSLLLEPPVVAATQPAVIIEPIKDDPKEPASSLLSTRLLVPGGFLVGTIVFGSLASSIERDNSVDATGERGRGKFFAVASDICTVSIGVSAFWAITQAKKDKTPRATPSPYAPVGGAQ